MLTDPKVPLIVVAMPAELRHALEAADAVDRQPIGPWVRWSAHLDGAPINLLLSGIGMVNAGAALSRSLCDLSPSVVINYGCAGAHQAQMNPGDVVIGTRYVHHRAVTVLDNGIEQHSGTFVSPEDTSHFLNAFEADSNWLAAARAAALDWRPDSWPGTPDQVPTIYSGPLTSADCWTQAAELIDQIHSEHGTFCEDMEASALAQICWMHDLPFLAIKDISNNEYHLATGVGEVGGPSLEAVMDEVGRRAFALVRRMLRDRAE